MTDAITTAPHGQGRGCVITRRACFSSSHRYWLPELSADDNAARFGSCSMAPGHGHNYELIVHVTGDIDPETGYVMDMKILKDLIKNEVEDKMDHKNLNEEVAEFFDLIPTAENMVVVIYNSLKPHLNPEHTLEVTLYETPRNYVSYSE